MKPPLEQGLCTLRRLADFARVGRRGAKELGQPVYWAGSPCPKGHTTWRYVANRVCVLCQRENVRQQNYKRDNAQAAEGARHRRQIEALQEDRDLARLLHDPLYDDDLDEEADDEADDK